MLQPSFQIRQNGFDEIDFYKTNLYLDFGAGHFAFAVMHSNANRFAGLEFFQLKNSVKQDDLKEILSTHQLLQKNFNRVLVCFNTRESVLLPDQLYQEAYKEQVLATVHGDLNTGIVLEESTHVDEMKNIYRIPHFYKETIARIFPASTNMHVYSVILKALEHRKKFFPATFIYVVFYPNQIILTLVIDHQLQLIQTFPYDIPEDVSYHMLNIADQFSLSADEIAIKVCGLIDTDSVLFTEILKYFIHVETDPRPGHFSYDEAFDAYPAHFFTPVFSIGLCV